MIGVGCILFCCVLFVHMGLGDIVCKVIRRNLSLFSCVKCFTFWTVSAYTILFTDLEPIVCVSTAFATSYIALWLDLIFSKLAVLYEKIYKSVVAEEGECSVPDGTKEDKG